MAKLWAITVREYMERVRTKWFLFSTIFGPLFFGTLMFLPAVITARTKASSDVAQIAILDATGTGLGKRIATELNGGLGGDTSGTLVREIAPAELAAAESLATELVRRKETKGYLVLDANTIAGTKARYAGRNASAVSDMTQLERVTRLNVLAIRLERAGVDPAQSAVLTQMKLNLETERITDRGRGGSGKVSIIFAFTVSFMLYMSIFLYGQAVLRGVMEEKQSRVAEVIISSVPATKLLAGKVLGVGAVGMTQLTVWVATSLLLLQYRAPILARFGAADTPFNLPDISLGMGLILILFFVTGYMMYASLFAAVGAMVSTEQEAQQAQMPVVLLLVSSIMFIQPILSKPTGGLAQALSWLPFSAPIVMPLRMSVLPLPTFEIVVSLVSVIAGCYIAVYIAARIYRTGMLMYGKRPTMAEMARWVRFAG